MNLALTTADQIGKSAGSMADRATDMLRLAILTLELSPSQHIDENSLARRMKVGRTPSREALNRLSAEGLVSIEPLRGAFVAPLDTGEINQFIAAQIVARKAVAHFCHIDAEGLRADLLQLSAGVVVSPPDTVLRATCRQYGAFHVRMARAMHNDHLFKFSRRIEAQALRFGCWLARCLGGDGDDVAKTMNSVLERRLVVAAIASGDRERLSEALTIPLNSFHDALRSAAESS